MIRKSIMFAAMVAFVSAGGAGVAFAQEMDGGPTGIDETVIDNTGGEAGAGDVGVVDDAGGGEVIVADGGDYVDDGGGVDDGGVIDDGGVVDGGGVIDDETVVADGGDYVDDGGVIDDTGVIDGEVVIADAGEVVDIAGEGVVVEMRTPDVGGEDVFGAAGGPVMYTVDGGSELDDRASAEAASAPETPEPIEFAENASLSPDAADAPASRRKH